MTKRGTPRSTATLPRPRSGTGVLARGPPLAGPAGATAGSRGARADAPPGTLALPAAAVGLGKERHGGGAEEAGPEAYRIVHFDVETERLITGPEAGGAPSGRRTADPRRERATEIGAVRAATGAELQQLTRPEGPSPEPHGTGPTNHEAWRSRGKELREVSTRFCAQLQARPPARGARRGPEPSNDPAGGPGREPRDPDRPDLPRHADLWSPDRKNAADRRPGSPGLRAARRFVAAGP